MRAIPLFAPEDRRRRPRTAAQIEVEDTQGGPPLLARDIGVGGMRVVSRKLRWPGEHVHVRFQLPNSVRAICATCRVSELWETGTSEGVGLRLTFLELAPLAELTILRYVMGRWQKRQHQNVPELAN